MAYQEVEQVGLKRQRSKQAIALAMQGRWKEAVAINKAIIESFPDDAEAYNRLGKAYLELGQYAEAREAYRRAVEIDPHNTVAMKNLRRLSYLGEAVSGVKSDADKVGPEQFIEEVGKAGVVNLYRLGSPETRARMVTGDRVYLRVDGPNLIVENGHGEYLGLVEPRHGQRLVRLIEGGNRYSAAIVSSAEDSMSIIIREEYQDPSQAGRLSFPPREIEGPRTHIGDKILRRELEHEEELEVEPGYTIIGGDEIEVLPAELADIDDDTDEE